MAGEPHTPSPAEQVAQMYEQAEAKAAKAAERLVGSGGFVSMLGQLAENAAALTRLGNDALDLTLRNARLAGRRDIIRLARQLGRSEDKLERVLQELEQVHDELRELRSRVDRADRTDRATRDDLAARDDLTDLGDHLTAAAAVRGETMTPDAPPAARADGADGTEGPPLPSVGHDAAPRTRERS